MVKPINDTCGHTMGDRVLERAARAISGAFRPQDYVCRIGGDEFAVIMAHISCGRLIKEFGRLFREADAALYRVKNTGGRGCEVCL